MSDTIRVRSCQLINQIFFKLVGVDLSQDLCKKIETNLFPRFQVSVTDNCIVYKKSSCKPIILWFYIIKSTNNKSHLMYRNNANIKL